MGLATLHFIKYKRECFALPFVFGGNEGALNPQLAQGELTELHRESGAGSCYGSSDVGLATLHFIKYKRECLALPFVFGGNEGARTHDLTDVNRAL